MSRQTSPFGLCFRYLSCMYTLSQLIVERIMLTIASVVVIIATVFILSSKLFVKTPPHGSAMIDAFWTIGIAIKKEGFQNARPTVLHQNGNIDKHAFAQSSNYTEVVSVRFVQASQLARYIRIAEFVILLCADDSLVFRLCPAVLHLLDPDMEQSYILSWTDVPSRNTKRSSPKPGSHRADDIYPLARL